MVRVKKPRARASGNHETEQWLRPHGGGGWAGEHGGGGDDETRNGKGNGRRGQEGTRNMEGQGRGTVNVEAYGGPPCPGRIMVNRGRSVGLGAATPPSPKA